MSEFPRPYAATREFTFREFIDMLAKCRGRADNGVERWGAISRPLREFIRAAPPDHNLADLLNVAPPHLTDELARVGDIYALMTQSDADVIREALALVPAPGRRRRRRRVRRRPPID